MCVCVRAFVHFPCRNTPSVACVSVCALALFLCCVGNVVPSSGGRTRRRRGVAALASRSEETSGCSRRPPFGVEGRVRVVYVKWVMPRGEGRVQNPTREQEHRRRNVRPCVCVCLPPPRPSPPQSVLLLCGGAPPPHHRG